MYPYHMKQIWNSEDRDWKYSITSYLLPVVVQKYIRSHCGFENKNQKDKHHILYSFKVNNEVITSSYPWQCSRDPNIKFLNFHNLTFYHTYLDSTNSSESPQRDDILFSFQHSSMARGLISSNQFQVEWRYYFEITWQQYRNLGQI